MILIAGANGPAAPWPPVFCCAVSIGGPLDASNGPVATAMVSTVPKSGVKNHANSPKARHPAIAVRIGAGQ